MRDHPQVCFSPMAKAALPGSLESKGLANEGEGRGLRLPPGEGRAFLPNCLLRTILQGSAMWLGKHSCWGTPTWGSGGLEADLRVFPSLRKLLPELDRMGPWPWLLLLEASPRQKGGKK